MRWQISCVRCEIHRIPEWLENNDFASKRLDGMHKIKMGIAHDKKNVMFYIDLGGDKNDTNNNISGSSNYQV